MHYEPAPRSVSVAVTGDDDRSLVARIISGDRDALVSLMQRYNQRLYRLAAAIVCDESEAEDILQESYVRALRHLADYSGERSIGAWLAGIVRHEAIDRLRLYQRRRAHVVLEADVPGQQHSEDLPLAAAQADEVASDPEIAMQRAQVKCALELEIGRLPVQFRTVFVLREIEGLSVEETADYLAIPEATVRSRDFRARAILRSKLGERMDASALELLTFLNEECAALTARVLVRAGY
jgi:RNA polymerase sigma-70 factor (ECF subfamily)